MSFIGKEVKSLKAIKGLDASAITADHLFAIQSELKDEFEIEGIEVLALGTLQAANDKLATAEASLSTANNTIATKTTELEAAITKVSELTAKLAQIPAAIANEPIVNIDNIPEGDKDTFIEDLSARIKSEAGL